MKQIYDISELLRRASSRIEEILRILYPDTKIKRVGSSFKFGNIDGADGNSFAISAKPQNAGVYFDHQDPTVNGDVIGLISYRKGIERRPAIVWLADFVGLSPQETFESNRKHNFDADLTKILFDLMPKGIKHAESRKLSKETLQKYRVASSKGGHELLMPHYTDTEQLGMVQHRPVSDSKRSPWSNDNPYFTLFGKHLVDPNKTKGEVIITEGHWDAMSWGEIGIPAVSIPGGAENHKWISNDYHWLNQFTTIFLNYDNDEVGIKACDEAIRRLGPDRCKIIRLPKKDANEHLKAGEADLLRATLKEVRKSPLPELINYEDIESNVWDVIDGKHTEAGTPCFFKTLPIRFRLHEWTLWFGYTSHGKSAAVKSQIAYEASLRKYSLVASFEETPQQTIGNIMLQLTADPRLSSRAYRKDVYLFCKDQIRIYNSMKRVKPERLLGTMRAAHSQLGVQSFVIDNVMTLDADRQDNTVQAETADMIRCFVAENAVHTHCVAHPRKQKDNAVSPPNISEVRGASEWVDMPQNVITVFRSMEKHEKLADMINGGFPPEDIIAYDNATPDGRFYVRKQRETGDVPIARFWFNKAAKRFLVEPGEPIPWWIPDEPSSDLGIG